MQETISYNAVSHAKDDRLKPPLYHSRYRHLRELKKSIDRVIQEVLIKEQPDVFVDMGCGEIPYKSIIAPHVKHFYAVDLPGNPKATHFVDITTNKTNLPDEVADVVWSVMVLEHVADPEKYLQECYRVLKPGGKLVLCTHGHWMFHPDPIDYWRWTSQGLKVEVQKHPFSIKEFWGVMGLFSMSVQLFQDAVLLHFPYTRIWKGAFCFVMQRFVSLAAWWENRSSTTKAYKNKDACVFFVIAEKINQ
jgi:SAM-dependent methyltransferase